MKKTKEETKEEVEAYKQKEEDDSTINAHQNNLTYVEVIEEKQSYQTSSTPHEAFNDDWIIKSNQGDQKGSLLYGLGIRFIKEDLCYIFWETTTL